MADENENGVKISALTTAHRADLEGAYVPVALPNQQTYKVPLEDFTDPLEIMVAVYGTTPAADIAAAITAGKTIFAARQVSSVTRLAPLTDHSIGAYHFVWQNSDGTREIWELTSNGWTADELPGGASELFTDSSLTGSGTQDDPLGVSIEELEDLVVEGATEAVDAVRSKIVYTLELGSVTGGQNTDDGIGNLYARATLFNPNMNQPLNTTDSKIIVATNQTGNCTHAYLALYRYDLLDNTIHWVANTDNIASEISSQTGIHIAPLTHVAVDGEGNPVPLLSSKMYYLVLISNCNSIKFAGNAISENLNSTPRLAFKIDNMNNSDLSAATIQTKFPTLTPEGEYLKRYFAAITNVQTSN